MKYVFDTTAYFAALKYDKALLKFLQSTQPGNVGRNLSSQDS